MSGFPKIVLAALIVSSGIYLLDGYDSRAAWLLAFFVLLGVAFGYSAFGNEIMGLLGGQSIAPNAPQPNTVMPGTVGPIPGTYA